MEYVDEIELKGIWRDYWLFEGIWNWFIEIAYNYWINLDIKCVSFCAVLAQFRRSS